MNLVTLDMGNQPLAYFLTFITYSQRLHGDERGTVDRDHNIPGTPFLPADPLLEDRRRQQLKHKPTVLDEVMRSAVEAAIQEVCQFRGWSLLAINVRTNHVHVVVASTAPCAYVLRDFKSYATRRIRREGHAAANIEIWADGGSQRKLFTQEAVVNAVRYTVEGQGPDLPAT